MMAKEITVDTDLLKTDIDTMQESLTQLNKLVEDVFSDITELDTMWDGPANEEFNRQFKSDYETMKSQCDVINNMIEHYDYADKEYVKCENEVDSIVKSIKISM